jgi:hypothetical protein
MINQWMLLMEIIAVYFENHTKFMNALCEKSEPFLNVNTGGTYSYHYSSGLFLFRINLKLCILEAIGMTSWTWGHPVTRPPLMQEKTNREMAHWASTHGPSVRVREDISCLRTQQTLLSSRLNYRGQWSSLSKSMYFWSSTQAGLRFLTIPSQPTRCWIRFLYLLQFSPE